MIQKYIPNSVLSCMEYAKRCDHYIMRDTAKNYGFPNKKILLNDIKNGDSVWCHAMQLVSLFNYIETTDLKDLILISGDEDNSTNPNGTLVAGQEQTGLNSAYSVVKFLPKHFKTWYSQNANVVNNTMVPIPIGLCPPWGMGVSNSEELSKMIGEYERNNLLYINFTTVTNPIQRTQIFDIVTGNMKTMCTIASYTYEKNDMLSYYKGLQEHMYVLCPPGNGKDTHRLWESLYCGAIPIVEYSEANVYFAKMFPILVIERWSDITPEFLEKQTQRFMSTIWQYNLLDCDNLLKEHAIKIKGII